MQKRNDAEFESIWTLWRTHKIDLTLALRSEELPEEIEEAEFERYHPQADATAYLRYVHHSRKFYNICATVLCVVFAFVMLLAVGNLPSYGSADAPTNNEVAHRYVESGMEETGAVNTVAGMILDYRAFDTLGESFVLFTAVGAVTILMKQSGRRVRHKPGRELVNYAADPIVRSVCRFIFPIIVMFGLYILLNGHLSPGGGFSGGAVLGAGLIIYTMVWGEEQASRIFSEKLVKIVTFCSLGFYCLAKSYSFFTGANELHSVISAGTPGRIFSAGLILPLNVAVGCVVCCTMYSFYMYFRRGKL